MAFDPHIFPSTNDVINSGDATGFGSDWKESNVVALWAQAMGASHNYTISGAAGSAPGSGLVQTIPTGEHFIAGYYVNTGGSDTITVTDASTEYIYIELTRDGSDNVTGVQLGKTSTYTNASATADRVIVGKTVSSGGNITSYTDLRRSRQWRPSGVIAYSTNGGVATATTGTIAMDTTLLDTDEMADLGNNGFTIVTPGIYKVDGFCRIDAESGLSLASVFIALDGTAQSWGRDMGTTDDFGIWAHLLMELDAGDLITMQMSHNDSDTVAYLGNGTRFNSHLNIYKVGDAWESVTL